MRSVVRRSTTSVSVERPATGAQTCWKRERVSALDVKRVYVNVIIISVVLNGKSTMLLAYSLNFNFVVSDFW